MLTLVPQSSRATEARELVRFVTSWQPILSALQLLLLPLLGVCLLVAGSPAVGGFLIGAAVALALSRYGPSWWPGRR